MKAPHFPTTAEMMADAKARHERDTRPGGSPLVMAQAQEEGQSPHKKHFAVFVYADGSQERYGPAGGREYRWTRKPATH